MEGPSEVWIAGPMSLNRILGMQPLLRQVARRTMFHSKMGRGRPSGESIEPRHNVDIQGYPPRGDGKGSIYQETLLGPPNAFGKPPRIEGADPFGSETPRSFFPCAMVCRTA